MPTGSPALSIITVVRNARDALARTAASIRPLAEKLDIEWIVIDGASTDSTMLFLGQLDEPWMRVTSEPDDGLYDAMNKGIERARGDLVWFLNAGDLVAIPDELAGFIRSLPDGRAHRLYFGDALERDDEGTFLQKRARDPKSLHLGLFAHHQAMLFGREALAPFRYDQRLSIAADYALVARMWRDGVPFERIPLPVCVFERGGASTAHALRGMIEQARAKHVALALPWWRAGAIGLAQIAVVGFRRLLPAVYDRLRFSRPKVAHS
ncbi:MAG: glycosyltransferase [Xanthobacteraceae bacterium]